LFKNEEHQQPKEARWVLITNLILVMAAN